MNAEWHWMVSYFSMLPPSWPTSTRDNCIRIIYIIIYIHGEVVWGRSFSCFQPHGYAPFDPVGMHPATRINEALPYGEWSKVGTHTQIWSFLVAKCVGRMWKSIQIDPYVRAGPLVNYGPAPSVWFQVLLSLACSWAKRSFFAKGHKTTNWIANSLVNLTSQFWSTLIQQLDTTRTLYPPSVLVTFWVQSFLKFDFTSPPDFMGIPTVSPSNAQNLYIHGIF